VQGHSKEGPPFFRPSSERRRVSWEKREFAPKTSSVPSEIEQSYVAFTKGAGEAFDCFFEPAAVWFEHKVGFKADFREGVADRACVSRGPDDARQLPVFGDPDNKREPALCISRIGAQGSEREHRQKKRADHRRSPRVAERQLTRRADVPTHDQMDLALRSQTRHTITWLSNADVIDFDRATSALKDATYVYEMWRRA
jgi:hypothetical protein